MAVHIETYIERAWRKYAEHWRAQVIDTATGRVLYTTWPYAHGRDAVAAAKRWMRDERQRARAENTVFFGQFLEKESG